MSLKSARFHKVEDVKQSAKISLIFFLVPPAATESCLSFNTSHNWSFRCCHCEQDKQWLQDLLGGETAKWLRTKTHWQIGWQKTPTQNKALRTDRPWSHSAFDLRGSVQSLLHKMFLTAWTNVSRLIISNTIYLDLAPDACAEMIWKRCLTSLSQTLTSNEH